MEKDVVIEKKCTEIKTKVCSKCKQELTYNKFSLIKSGMRKGVQRHRCAACCIDCDRDNELFKT